MNDSRWPWLILVPRREDLVELIDLDAADRGGPDRGSGSGGGLPQGLRRGGQDQRRRARQHRAAIARACRRADGRRSRLAGPGMGIWRGGALRGIAGGKTDGGGAEGVAALDAGAGPGWGRACRPTGSNPALTPPPGIGMYGGSAGLHRSWRWRLRRGCSSMVEQQPSKLNTRVRFPLPAPILKLAADPNVRR